MTDDINKIAKNHETSSQVKSKIPSDIIKLFETNNKQFKILPRPGIFASEKRKTNYKKCMNLFRELKIKENDFKIVFSYTSAFINELDKFVKDRTDVEQKFYENMKNSKSNNSSFIPQQAPEDAGQAQFKALEEKKQQIKKVFDAIENYNSVIREIIDYYEDNFSPFRGGVIGFIEKENLPSEIDVQFLF